jgi:hypothetical protein
LRFEIKISLSCLKSYYFKLVDKQAAIADKLEGKFGGKSSLQLKSAQTDFYR